MRFKCTSTIHRLVRHHWGWIPVFAVWGLISTVNLCGKPSPEFGHGDRFLVYSGQDFDQYYAAGVAVADHLCKELYPDPSYFVKGVRPASAPYRKRMHEALKKRGAWEQTKNIYPPPTALLFWPLSWWDFLTARRIFFLIEVISVFLLLWLVYRESKDLAFPPWAGNLLVAVVGSGTPIFESVANGNVSVFIAIATMLVVRGIRLSRTVQTVSGFVFAGLTKGYSAVWIPALLLWKQWRTIACGAIVGTTVLVAASFLGAGVDVWKEYLFDVLPISRNYLRMINEGNLCYPSFFSYIAGWKTWTDIPAWFSVGMKVAKWILYVLAYSLGFFASRRNLLAGQTLSLLVATMVFQTFSTICWPHYGILVVPFLPTAIVVALKREPGVRIHSMSATVSDARSSPVRKTSLLVLLFGFSLVWFPVGNTLKILLGCPVLGYGRLFGYAVLTGWALSELFQNAIKAPSRMSSSTFTC